MNTFEVYPYFIIIRLIDNIGDFGINCLTGGNLGFLSPFVLQPFVVKITVYFHELYLFSLFVHFIWTEEC